MYVRNLGYPLLDKSRVQNPTFFDNSQLTGNFSGQYLRKKRDRHNRTSALQTTRGLPHRLKMSLTLVHTRLKIGPEFLHTLRKFCCLRHCQTSQTEISELNSTKHCQTVDRKSRGQKTLYICSLFRRLRDLIANIFWMKDDIDNRERALESTRGILRRLKIS